MTIQPFTADKISALLNQVWSDFLLNELIGQGVYSDVYRITKTDSSYSAALKIIYLPEEPKERINVLSAAKKEIRIMNMLRSAPNIVHIEDSHISEAENCCLIRMELLSPIAKIPEFRENDVIRLGMDLCNALTICADNHILHRDIKPDNIYYDSYGGFKLGDFGISAFEDDADFSDTCGSKNYLAPETELQNQSDARSDLYSLGLVLYSLMNHNRVPFLPLSKQILSLSDYENAHINRMKGLPMQRPCMASNRFSEIVLRACAFQTGDRFQTAVQMKEALAECLSDKTAQKKGIHSFAYICGAFLFACLLLTGGYFLHSLRNAPAQTVSPTVVIEQPAPDTEELCTETETETIAEADTAIQTAQQNTYRLEAAGVCGNHTYWTYGGTVFTVYGSGAVDTTVRKCLTRDQCSMIETVIIDEGITSLPDYFMYNLPLLSAVVLPDSLQSIGEKLAEKSLGLTHIRIPDHVTDIGSSAFSFSGIRSIALGNNGNFIIEDNILYTADRTKALYSLVRDADSVKLSEPLTYIACDFQNANPNLTEIVLPDTLQLIDWNAFSHCDRLKTVVIPASVTEIKAAFSDCLNLSDIYFEGNAPQNLLICSNKLGLCCTIHYRPDTTGWEKAKNAYPKCTFVEWTE